MGRCWPVLGQVCSHGRLQQTESARWTHVGVLCVFKWLPTCGLKVFQPVDYCCYGSWKRGLAICVQPPHVLGPTLAKNFRPETFGFLTNQPTVDAGESTKIGTREQLLQVLELFVLNFAVQPLRWPKGGQAL